MSNLFHASQRAGGDLVAKAVHFSLAEPLTDK